MGEDCIASAVLELRFDGAEVWATSTGCDSFDFKCLRRYQTARSSSSSSSLSYNNEGGGGVHCESLTGGKKSRLRLSAIPPHVSRLLRTRAMNRGVPLWYTTTTRGTPLDTTNKTKTVVVIPIFSFQAQREICIILSALQEIESTPVRLTYLRDKITQSTVAACLGLVEADGPPHIASPTAIGSIAVQASTQLPLEISHPPKLQWKDIEGNMRYLREGGSSLIYTSHLEGQPVIVKILKDRYECKAQYCHLFEKEMQVLQSLDHPHVVKCVGFGMEPRPFMVTELLDGGTLNQRLGFAPKYKGSHRRTFYFKNTSKALSYPEALRCALQIAEALRYLHNDALPGYAVIHRDLKPDNIGFTADGTCKLLDFGLCKILPKDEKKRADVVMSGGTGSLRYMAPEVAFNWDHDEKMDVYSFSFILWEMTSGSKPFPDYSRRDFCKYVIRHGKRPLINPKWPPGFVRLLESCWHFDPARRPSSSEVVETLRGLIDQHQEEQQLRLDGVIPLLIDLKVPGIKEDLFTKIGLSNRHISLQAYSYSVGDLLEEAVIG